MCSGNLESVIIQLVNDRLTEEEFELMVREAEEFERREETLVGQEGGMS